MNKRKSLISIFKWAVIALIFIAGGISRAQDKRFGIDPSPSKRTDSDQESSRRYLPLEFNHRFGVNPGESEIETAPAPIEREQSLVSKAAQQVAQGEFSRAISTYRQAIAAK